LEAPTDEHTTMSGRIETMLARRAGREPQPCTLSSRPQTGVAVLTCMDARLDVYRILALRPGDANVIRNAGGMVTEDVTLALAVSQRMLGTREILVVHHLDCAMRHVRDAEVVDGVERDTGRRPPWAFATCPDPRLRVWEAVRLLASDPYLHDTELVRGYLYDETADTLTELCQARSMTGHHTEEVL
jgi:carbonic anhydrase